MIISLPKLLAVSATLFTLTSGQQAAAPAAAAPAAAQPAAAQPAAAQPAAANPAAPAAAGADTATPVAAGAAPVANTAVAGAADGSELVGTWSSKSKKVHTGPGFYDPVKDNFIEPDLPGISYSFTSDGWFEEAYYRVEPNPNEPRCPKGAMQWQHGKWTRASNGSLTMKPLAVDGRMLISDPCQYKDEAVYKRFHQKEFFKRYEVVIDKYHNVKRLNLYQFDGKPLIPLYLAYSPPQMLPTQTLNPTQTASATGAGSTSTGSKHKRSVSEPKLEAYFHPRTSRFLDPSTIWWFGVICTGLGTLTYAVF